MTDGNGLIHMRARYYSPEMRRFVNADVVPGQISNAITLNRFAYANGNPVSFIDPFGLSADKSDFPQQTGAEIEKLLSEVHTTKDQYDVLIPILNLIRNKAAEMFSVKKAYKLEYQLDPTTKVYLKMAFKDGGGDNELDIDQVTKMVEADGILELLDECGGFERELINATYEKKLGSSTTAMLKFTASSNILSLTTTLNVELAVKQTIGDDGFFLIAIGMTKEIKKKPPRTPIKEPVLYHVYEPVYVSKPDRLDGVMETFPSHVPNYRDAIWTNARNAIGLGFAASAAVAGLYTLSEYGGTISQLAKSVSSCDGFGGEDGRNSTTGAIDDPLTVYN